MATGSGAQTTVDQTPSLRLYGPEKELRQFTKLVTACTDELSVWMSAPAGALPLLRIYLAEHRPVSEGPNVLHLSPDLNLQQAVHRLNMALLKRHASTFFSDTVEVQPSQYDWIAAGLTGFVLNSQRPGTIRPLPNYEPVRRLMRKGIFLPVADMLATPVPPEHPIPYQLYATYCGLLMECLRSSFSMDQRPLQTVLQMAFSNRKPVDALGLLLFSQASAAGVQDWFYEKAWDISRRGRRAATAGQIARRMQSIRRITVPVATADGVSSRELTLADLPILMKQFGRRPAIIFGLQAEIFELAKDSPPLVYDALQLYMQALHKLDKGSNWNYGRLLRKADKAFAASIQRHKEIERYLEEIEPAFSTPDEMLPLHMHADRESDLRRRSLFPELHAYLDSLELQRSDSQVDY